ncbi:MAG: ATP-binding protein [Bacteroidota bacterium]
MALDISRLFLNKEVFFRTSEPDRQRVILTGAGAAIAVLVCLFFVVVESLIGTPLYIPFYAIMILFSTVSLVLLRIGKHDSAKIVFIGPILLVIAVLASIEKQATGVYLYFLAACVYIVTIFGYEKLKYSIMFFLLTVVLAFVSYFYTIELNEPLELTQQYIDTSYTTNFVVSLFSSLLAIYFLMKMNIKSNEHLVKTSKELKKSENKFQLAIQGSSAGIWEWDAYSDQIQISPKLADLLGYDQADLTSLSMQSMLSFIHPDDLDNAKIILLNHFKKRTPFSVECRARTKVGEYIWVLDTGQAEWDEHGRAVRMVGTILDINKRKCAEQQVKEQNQLLEKANRELDRFVYSTSHDLKAPLSSVQGLISIAELTTDEKERQQVFHLMKQRISNLNRFIADITNYSRNSRLDTCIEEVDVPSLIEEILEDLEHFEERNKIDIETDLAEGLSIYTDKYRLKIILSNLLNNAIKYHNYELSNPKIQIKGYRESSVEVIEIIDNGTGIGQEHISSIFNMFYRATEKSDGSGLGLYIVKEAVEKLKGSIVVHSETNLGSVFTVRLPKSGVSNKSVT